MFSIPVFRKKALPPKVLSYLTDLENSTSLTVYTFAATTLGPASASRRIHVGVFGGGNAANVITGVTVGGIAATINVQITNSNSEFSTVGIVTAAVPTGVTGDIVVTFAGGRQRCNIGVWASTGMTGQVAVDTKSSVVAAAFATTLNTLVDGFALGVHGNGANGGTVAWLGVTERYEMNPGGAATCSGADGPTTGVVLNVTSTPTPTPSDCAFVFASF